MSENSNTNSNDKMTVIENNTDIESFSVDISSKRSSIESQARQARYKIFENLAY